MIVLLLGLLKVWMESLFIIISNLVNVVFVNIVSFFCVFEFIYLRKNLTSQWYKQNHLYLGYSSNRAISDTKTGEKFDRHTKTNEISTFSYQETEMVSFK